MNLSFFVALTQIWCFLSFRLTPQCLCSQIKLIVSLQHLQNLQNPGRSPGGMSLSRRWRRRRRTRWVSFSVLHATRPRPKWSTPPRLLYLPQSAAAIRLQEANRRWWKSKVSKPAGEEVLKSKEFILPSTDKVIRAAELRAEERRWWRRGGGGRGEQASHGSV